MTAATRRLSIGMAMIATLLVWAVPPASGRTFPGADGLIAFESDRDDEECGDPDIFAMNPDGSNQVNLTNTECENEEDAAWSADGKKIAFEGQRDEQSDDDIYVMNADGSGVTRVTTDEGADMNPTWSPDGTKIAFNSDRDGGDMDIFVMNATGTESGVVNLTDNDRIFDSEPDWSPDGTKILFESDEDENSQIFVMNASNGSGRTQLTEEPDSEATDGSWSPDGTKIAYELNGFEGPFRVSEGASSQPTGGDDDIWVMNANGTGEDDVTNTDDINESNPVWSPQGTRIAYQSEDLSGQDQARREAEGGQQVDFEIAVMNANGTGAAERTNNEDTDEEPDWQPVRCPGLESVPGNHIIGTDAGETLVGTPGDDVICGLGGNDTIRGLHGNDLILGGTGNDTIRAGHGNDEVRGEAGKDKIFGQPGGDDLKGEGGPDNIKGGRGNDTLNGGPAKDTCKGGSGKNKLKSCEKTK